MDMALEMTYFDVFTPFWIEALRSIQLIARDKQGESAYASYESREMRAAMRRPLLSRQSPHWGKVSDRKGLAAYYFIAVMPIGENATPPKRRALL